MSEECFNEKIGHQKLVFKKFIRKTKNFSKVKEE